MIVLEAVRGFDWDPANLEKVEAKGFTALEVEQAFLNGRGTLFPDLEHSGSERRYWLIGATDEGRHVTVPFAIRQERIRPITAWTTNRKYRRWAR